MVTPLTPDVRFRRNVLKGHKMLKFDLADAVELFSEQSTNITSLWTVYVVATFAAAGYSIAIKDNTIVPEPIVIAAVTLGFWCFTLGHLTLLCQALSVNLKLAADIKSCLPSEPDETFRFKPSLHSLSRTANRRWLSICIHLIIDFCVTVALWAPVLWPNAVKSGFG
jgi:hypothetical protein